MASESDSRENGGRPYRSHLQPACYPCRSRKSRCKTTYGTATCDVCHKQGTSCYFPPASNRRATASSGSSRRKSSHKARGDDNGARIPTARTRCLSSTSPNISQRILQPYSSAEMDRPDVLSSSSPSILHHHASTSPADHPAISALVDVIAESEQGSTHVVSPAIADDDRVFHEYFSNAPYGQGRRMVRSYLNANSERPILFGAVPKRGEREAHSRMLAADNLEAIESVLHPHCNELIDLFFEKVNIPFPIFDELLFRRVFMTHKASMSPGLLSNFYGNALIYWNSSSELRQFPWPDHRFVWVQAEHALNTELICTPGISTIITILLNVSGRPSSHHLGNSGIIGMAVSLANAFGLNRDPSDWNLSPPEKKFRIRVWWLVIIYDRWCSLAYGTPPLIHFRQYDVPFLTIEDLCALARSSNEQLIGASGFLALASLTEVLGHCLEHVYYLRKGSATGHTAQTPSRLEGLLTEWEDSLDDHLRRLVLRGTSLSGPGLANLRLSYLAVKLLILRSQLEWDRLSLKVNDMDSRYYIQVRRIAEEIVDFVRELDETNLRDFWVPLNAYTLTSATTFLMRSALNSRQQMSNPSLRLARLMIDTLQAHRRDHSWDLADHCLLNCKDLVTKIESACQQATMAGVEFESFISMDLDRDIEALSGLPSVVGDADGYDGLLI